MAIKFNVGSDFWKEQIKKQEQQGKEAVKQSGFAAEPLPTSKEVINQNKGPVNTPTKSSKSGGNSSGNKYAFTPTPLKQQQNLDQGKGPAALPDFASIASQYKSNTPQILQEQRRKQNEKSQQRFMASPSSSPRFVPRSSSSVNNASSSADKTERKRTGSSPYAPKIPSFADEFRNFSYKDTTTPEIVQKSMDKIKDGRRDEQRSEHRITPLTAAADKDGKDLELTLNNSFELDFTERQKRQPLYLRQLESVSGSDKLLNDNVPGEIRAERFNTNINLPEPERVQTYLNALGYEESIRSAAQRRNMTPEEYVRSEYKKLGYDLPSDFKLSDLNLPKRDGDYLIDGMNAEQSDPFLGTRSDLIGPDEIKIPDYRDDDGTVIYKNGSGVHMKNYMTDSELNYYYYFLGRGGKLEARQYLNEIRGDIIRRAASEQQRNEFVRIGERMPVLSSAVKAMVSVPSAGEAVKSVAKKALGKEVTDDDLIYSIASDAITEGKLNNSNNKLERLFYIALDGLAENAPSMLIGSVFGAAAKGLGLTSKAAKIGFGVADNVFDGAVGAGEKLAEHSQRGTLNEKGTLSTVLIAGAADGIELAGINKISNKAVGSLVKHGGKSALKTFAVGELSAALGGAGIGITKQVADSAVDKLLMGDNSQYDITKRMYMSSGMSEEQAASKALKDAVITPALSAAVIGGAMGAVYALPGSASQSIDFSREGADIRKRLSAQSIIPNSAADDRAVSDVIQLGLAFDKNSAAYKNAAELNGRRLKGTYITDSQLGAQSILNKLEFQSNDVYYNAVEELTGIKTNRDLSSDILEGGYENGKIHLNVSPESEIGRTFRHELAHGLENTPSYRKYISMLSEDKQFGDLYKSKKTMYDSQGIEYDENTIRSEVAAEFAENLIPKTAGDIDRLKRTAENNPKLIDRVYNNIRDLNARIKAKSGKIFTDDVTGFKTSIEKLNDYEKLLSSALTEVGESGYNDGSYMYKLRTKADESIYGINIARSVTSFYNVRDISVDSKFAVSARSDVISHVREAFEMYSANNPDGGYEKLRNAGEVLNQYAKGNDNNNIPDTFAKVFENEYYHARDVLIMRRKDAASAADMNDFNLSVPAYVQGVKFSEGIQESGRDTIRTETVIRNAYNALKNGASENDARQMLLPAAEHIVDSAREKDSISGEFTPKYTDNRAEAVGHFVDDMITYYRNEQPAAKETPDNIKSRDVEKYGVDIESDFRGLNVRNITEGEVKAFSDISRNAIDFVTSRKVYTTDNFQKQLDSELAKITYGRDRKASECCLINNMIVSQISDTSSKIINKRMLDAESKLAQLRKNSDGDSSLALEYEREIQTCKSQFATLANYSSLTLGTNSYRMSNPGMKIGKVMKGNTTFAEAVSKRLNDMVYKTKSNSYSAAYGQNYVDTHNAFDVYNELSADDKVWTAEDMATAAALCGEFSQMGENDWAADVYVLAQKKATAAGQASQAFALFYRMTPDGQISLAKNMVNEIIYNSFGHKEAYESKIKSVEEKDRADESAADEYLKNNNERYQSDDAEINRLREEVKSVKDSNAERSERINKLNDDAKAIEHQLELQIENQKRQASERLEAEKKKLAESDEKHKQELADNDRKKDLASKLAASFDRAEYKARKREYEINNGSDDSSDSIPDVTDEDIDNIRSHFGLGDDVEYSDDNLTHVINSDEAALRRRLNEIYDEIDKSEYELSGTDEKLDALHKRIRELRRNQSTTRSAYLALKQRGMLDDEINSELSSGIRTDLADDLKTHLDMLYDEMGVKYIPSSDWRYIEELASAVHDMDTPDEIIDVIMKLSGKRKKTSVYNTEAFDDKSTLDMSISQQFKIMHNDKIRERLKKAFGGTDEGTIKDLQGIATQQIFAFVSDLERATLGKKARTLMYMNQLLTVPTALRNILGNAFMLPLEGLTNFIGSGIDKGVKLITGQRSVGFKPSFKKAIEAGTERARMSLLEQNLNVDILDGRAQRIGKPTYKRVYSNPLFSRAERSLGYVLSVPDEFFKGVAGQTVSASLEKFLRHGLITQEELDKITVDEMKFRTFQDDSLPANMMKNLRDALNTAGIGKHDDKYIHEFGLGDLIIPYQIVPGNMVNRRLEYTPVGYLHAVKAIGECVVEARRNTKVKKALMVGDEMTKAEIDYVNNLKIISASKQRKAVLALARPISGAAAIAIGYCLANLGIISGNPQNEYSPEQYEKAKRTNKYTFNLSRLGRLLNGEGDKYENYDLLLDMSWIVPLNDLFSIGAYAANNVHDTTTPSWNVWLKAVSETTLEQFKSLPMFSGIQSIYNNYKYTENLSQFGAAMLSDFALSMCIPQVIRQTNNATDPYNRNPYKEANIFGVIKNKFKNAIPGNIGENVPFRVDIWGERDERTIGNTWADLANNLLNPSKATRYKSNALTDEIDRLLPQSEDILPKTPYRSYSFELNGQDYYFELNGEDYQNYSVLLGSTTYKAMYEFIMSNDYKYLPDSYKVKALEDISKNTATLVRNTWLALKQGEDSVKLQTDLDEFINSQKTKGSDVLKQTAAEEYIKRDGVNVQDVVDAGYWVDYTEEEKVQAIGEKNSYIQKIKAGKFRDSNTKLTSNKWTQAQRDEKIAKYQRDIDGIVSGRERKWVEIKGSFNSLSEDEKDIVLNKISRYPDEIFLPDDVMNSIPDFSGKSSAVIDVTKNDSVGGTLFNSAFKTEDYDTQRADEENGGRLKFNLPTPKNLLALGKGPIALPDFVSGFSKDESSDDNSESKPKTAADYLALYNAPSESGYKKYKRYYRKYRRYYSGRKRYYKSFRGGYGGSGGNYSNSSGRFVSNRFVTPRFKPRFNYGVKKGSDY